MSPLSPRDILDPNVDWRSKAASWMVQQGVATVLLFCILAGVYAGRKDVIVQIQEGYNHNALDLKEAVKAMSEQGKLMDKQFDRFVNQSEKREQLLIEVLRSQGNHTAIELPPSS